MAQNNNNKDFTSGRYDPFGDQFSTEDSPWNDQPSNPSVTHSPYNPFADNDESRDAVHVSQQHYNQPNLVSTSDLISLQPSPQSPTPTTSRQLDYTSTYSTQPTAISSAHLSHRGTKQKGTFFRDLKILICLTILCLRSI